MSPRRYAARVDPGQAAIVEALRKAGCLVAFWGTNGAPDLVVAHNEMIYLLEVKEPIGERGGSSRRGQYLTPAQLAFHGKWRAYVEIVRSVSEALQVVGLAVPTVAAPAAAPGPNDASRGSVARVADDHPAPLDPGQVRLP